MSNYCNNCNGTGYVRDGYDGEKPCQWCSEPEETTLRDEEAERNPQPVSAHEEKCPFCGTYVAHSPFGHIWCDQCDYRLETAKFENRPLEAALEAENARLREACGEAIDALKQAAIDAYAVSDSFFEKHPTVVKLRAALRPEAPKGGE